MASDELYKLAIEYDKQKLHQKMYSEQIFGVKLSDGRIAYCSVQGRHDGENFALVVYVGSEGLDSLRHSEINFEDISDNEAFWLNVSQNCLQCVFEEKAALTEEELEAEKSFGKRNKIYFRKKYSHPRFLKFTPLCLSRQIEDIEEEKILTQALSAAIEVSKKFPDNLPRRIKFLNPPPIRKKFPLLTSDGENYKWTMEQFPPFRRVKYPAAKLSRSDLKKLSAAKKTGTYCCEIFILPRTEEDDDGIFKFPVTLVIFDKTKRRSLEIEPVTDYIAAPEKLTAAVAEIFLNEGVPKKILVRSERTYIFLEKFCEQVGIELGETEDFHGVDTEEKNLLRELKIESLSNDKFIVQLLDLLENFSAEELKENLSKELKDLLEELYNEDIFSYEMEKEVEKIIFD